MPSTNSFSASLNAQTSSTSSKLVLLIAGPFGSQGAVKTEHSLEDRLETLEELNDLYKCILGLYKSMYTWVI